MLRGSRSLFTCDEVSDDIRTRAACGDLHPGLPLWGCGLEGESPLSGFLEGASLRECRDICEFLEAFGLDLAWRSARLLPDDFHWQFCDDDVLQLDFSLEAGSYATALLGEFVQYKEGWLESGSGGE